MGGVAAHPEGPGPTVSLHFTRGATTHEGGRVRISNRQTQTRTRAMTLVMCVMALVLLATTPVVSIAAPSTAGSVTAVGSISGTVTDGVNPIESITVTLYCWEDWGGGDGEWLSCTDTYTAADGTYSFTDLEPGTYRVGFSDWSTGTYAPEFYDDAPDVDSADDVVVNSGANTPNINAVLGFASHIKGKVTGGGGPLADVEVTAYKQVIDGEDVWWDMVSWAWTAADGTYDLDGLVAGTYRVEFDDFNGEFIGEYYNNAADLEAAQDIPVGSAATVSNINADLARAGHITGKVTGNGQPLDSASIQVMQRVTSGGDTWWEWMGEAYAEPDGTYDMGGLKTGTYRVYFYEWAGDYLPEYYDDAKEFEDATDISVTAGSTTANINADLDAASHITGTITGGGTPITNGYAEAMRYDTEGGYWDYSGSADVDQNGKYDIKGLVAGSYFVRFVDYEGVYAAEYYDDAARRKDATPVEVPAEGTASGIDADLAKAGHITGKVTGGGSPLEWIYVEAYQYVDGEWQQTPINGWTAPDGTYDVGGLQSGMYRVAFNNWGDYPYASEYYDDVNLLEDATDVSVTLGQTTSGINATLDLPGAITGKVTGPSGQPLADVRVDAYLEGNDGRYSEQWRSYTAADGSYSLDWLPKGEYCIAFRDAGDGTYATEYYNDKPVQDAYDAVKVTAGNTKSGVNAQLSVGATVSGHVSADESVAGASTSALAGLGDIRVVAWMNAETLGVGWQETGSGYSYAGVEMYGATGANAAAAVAEVSEVGDYTITGLKPGTYTLQFIDWGDGTYAPTFLGGAGYPSQAQTFTVAEGAHVTGKNQTMTAGVGYIPVAGVNRYETAVEASKRAFPSGADTVVIATGANWPDALGGAALAGTVNGPLLLTDPAAMPAAVEAEITRLGAENAYILGGTGAVSPAVEAKLAGMLGAANVTRLAGTDRYGTARAVADEVIALRGATFDGTAFVATGANFPDALGASPIAAAKSWPILLAPTSGAPYVPAAVDEAVILGGTGAVSAEVESSLKTSLGAAKVSRQGGLDRYATAALVAEFGTNKGLVWNGVGIATGAAFPDALSGGAMLGSLDTVMLLTPTASLAPSAGTALTDAKAEIGTVHFIGGTGAVSDAVRASVAQLLE